MFSICIQIYIAIVIGHCHFFSCPYMVSKQSLSEEIEMYKSNEHLTNVKYFYSKQNVFSINVDTGVCE